VSAACAARNHPSRPDSDAGRFSFLGRTSWQDAKGRSAQLGRTAVRNSWITISNIGNGARRYLPRNLAFDRQPLPTGVLWGRRQSIPFQCPKPPCVSCKFPVVGNQCFSRAIFWSGHYQPKNRPAVFRGRRARPNCRRLTNPQIFAAISNCGVPRRADPPTCGHKPGRSFSLFSFPDVNFLSSLEFLFLHWALGSPKPA